MPFLRIVELYYSECILFLSLIIKDLERQEELRTAQMNLKEHQETIDKLKLFQGRQMKYQISNEFRKHKYGLKSTGISYNI